MNEITLNLVGGGQLRLPKRMIRGYYKDFLNSGIKVQVSDPDKEYEVRESLIEIQYLMDQRS